MRLRGRCGATAAAAALLALVAQGSTASADAVDKIGKTLIKLESEVAILSQGIKRPKKKPQTDRANRRLVDAQVAFGLGNYDDAAVMLYDYVAKFPNSPAYDRALYYLAESLFQKGDSVASRTYFVKLVTEKQSSKFYQQGLERLIELSLKLPDAKVKDWLAALDSVPSSKRRTSVSYVRGKYYFFSGEYDKAIPAFERVPSSSRYYFQARYFIGTSHTAKKKLAAAIRVFKKLIETQPNRKNDRRVVELAHMALGRLHYERDQPSKAIDHYLRISRRSDLFDEALFEIAWVYVKNKEFEKALRALELLAIADPKSSRLPKVKILEGNLRIRKAQRLIKANKGNSEEEYTKAVKVFEGLQETFKKPHEELKKLLASRQDPRAFMTQITGRSSANFDTQSNLPNVAAAWLRQQPEVKRVVAIESDLGQIKDEIDTADRTITRLEKALNSSARTNIFPSLAEKQTRTVEILEKMFQLRIQLAAHERARISKHLSASERAELDKLMKTRQDIAKQLRDLPNAKLAYGARIAKAKNAYTQLDKRTAEVELVINTTEATLVALEKYIKDLVAKGEKPSKLEQTRKIIETLRADVNKMRGELKSIRTETVLARDAAGTGDAVAARTKLLKTKLRVALDDEHRYMQRVSSRLGGKDRTKLQQIASLWSRSNSATLKLDNTNSAINAIIDDALAEVKVSLREEKAKLAAYRREFVTYEAESRELGGKILGEGFKTVKKSFYDVLVRSDIGVIDVTWSKKETADESTKRLTLDKEREMRTLGEDFRDVLEEERRKRQKAADEAAKKRAAEEEAKRKLEEAAAKKDAADADKKKGGSK